MNRKWTTQQMPSQDGKTVLVTGANSGIGFQAAMAFAQHGAHVLLGCRNEDRGREAVSRLTASGVKGTAELAILDVASLDSIRRFTASFLARGVNLDTLVNNAGVMALPERQLTEDGFERQFGTNHLGHFALTGLLLPSLLQTASPRVVTVASLAHRNGKLVWDNLQAERAYVPWDAYNASKLANILFARELDRRARLQAPSLVSVSVHPGISRTNIFENGPGTGDFKARIVRLLAPVMTQNDAMGALPIEYAATMPGVQGGEYYGPDGLGEFKGFPTLVKPRPHALDSAAGQRLWQVSEQLTGVSYLDISGPTS